MDRNSFSYILLILCALSSFLYLSWMTYQGKFTFSYLGMLFIELYGLLIFSVYTPESLDALYELECTGRPYYNSQSNQTSPPPRRYQSPSGQAIYVQYRQFSESRHHHLSSHRFLLDDIQPECREPEEKEDTDKRSTELIIMEFCVFLLSIAFFTTDLFFAYQIFTLELNYIPMLGGLLNIIPMLYIGDGVLNHDLYIFTIPPNCWGQVYYAGFKQNNVYAMLAGYFFFVAFYYNDIQRIYKGMTPQAQANYFMSAYCICASIALQTAFSRFDVRQLNLT